jgi:hypothetical protein
MRPPPSVKKFPFTLFVISFFRVFVFTSAFNLLSSEAPKL